MGVRIGVKHASIDDYHGLEKLVQDTKAKTETCDVKAQMMYGMMIAGLPQLKGIHDQALPWFLKAAQADESDAQVSLAEYLLRSDSNRESVAGALVWLERASRQNNNSAKLLYRPQLLGDSGGRQCQSLNESERP